MPDARIASITSPEQGAQQECKRSLLCPSGNSSFSRIKGALGSLRIFCFRGLA